jgi:hypothetical protein
MPAYLAYLSSAERNRNHYRRDGTRTQRARPPAPFDLTLDTSTLPLPL